MKAQEISEWVEERNKALEKHDPKLIYNLIKKWEGIFYNKGDAQFFKSLSEPEQLLVICEMISKAPGLSNNARSWALQTKTKGIKKVLL